MKNTLLNNQVAMVLTDSNKKIEWINDTFSAMTGYTCEEIRGRKPSFLQGEKTEPNLLEALKEGIAKHLPFRSKLINYRKDKNQYECNLLVHPNYNNKNEVSHYIAFETDGSTKLNDSILLHLENINIYYGEEQPMSSLTYELSVLLQTTTFLLDGHRYCDPTLSLPIMSKELNLRTKTLSQIINKYTKNNVANFINAFRIELAKEKLIETEHNNLTYYGISQLCGFRNKSTFYKVFREFTTITPKKYVTNLGFN